MTRRKFALAVSTAVSGMMAANAAGKAMGQDDKPAKHVCKGMNECKGQGGCKTASNDCSGMNECKGQGGCATTAHHDCSGKNDCKGLGGCKSGDNGCAGKNECKGKGGCAVPLKAKTARRLRRRVHA